MKKIIFAFVLIFCISTLSAVYATEYYLTAFDVTYYESNPFGITFYMDPRVEEVFINKLKNMGMTIVSDKSTDITKHTIVASHTAYIDEEIIRERLARIPQFEVRDADGNTIIQEPGILSFAYYELEPGERLSNCGEVLYGENETTIKHFMGFNLRQTACEQFEEYMEKQPAGKDWFGVFINEEPVVIKKYKKGLAKLNIFQIYGKEEYDRLSSELRYDGKKLMPLETKIVSANVSREINCSDWALEYVLKMNEIGVADIDDVEDFCKPITRKEFCEYTARYLMAYSHRVTTGDIGQINDYYSSFSDTRSKEVAMLNKLGIINGRSSKIFAPDDNITREEAAAILNRMVSVIYGNDSLDRKTEYVFADDEKISDWARGDVYAVYALNIMNGVGMNNFDANGSYTVEQTFATLQRVMRSDDYCDD